LKNKPRIKLGCFDAYSPDFVEQQMKQLDVKFDIMIDDGPHTFESMKFFINNYLPMLADDGILIVEDVQSIDWIRELTDIVPPELKQFIKVYDLRNKKDRYDDILFVIDRS
jgi:hypothetical protein